PARGALRLLVRSHVTDADDPRQSLAFLRSLRAEVGESAIGEVLLSLEADVLLRLGRTDEARRVLEAQIARYPYPRGRLWDDALWRLADLVEDEAPRAAVDYLARMIAVHERSFFMGSYTRPRFSRAALRIARIYRDRLGDVDAALQAYAHVRSEFPRSL